MSWPIQSYTSCRRGSQRDSDGSIALECRSARGFRLVRLTAPTRTDTFSTIKVTREVASTPRLGGRRRIRHAPRVLEVVVRNITGRRLRRDAIERRLTHQVTVANAKCPSIKTKRVTMHTLRHTAAMRLLLAGNDITVIALWLGHEQISTTNVYLHADMTHKQRAIDRTKPLTAKPGRYGLPTHSSPSWRAFDYADPHTPITPVCKDFHAQVGITRRSA
jgi:integrase